MHLARSLQIVVHFGSKRVGYERERVHSAVQGDEFHPRSRRNIGSKGKHVLLIPATTQLDDLDDLHRWEGRLLSISSGIFGARFGLYTTPRHHEQGQRRQTE